jgi:hypothetical protein
MTRPLDVLTTDVPCCILLCLLYRMDNLKITIEVARQSYDELQIELSLNYAVSKSLLLLGDTCTVLVRLLCVWSVCQRLEFRYTLADA